jgi:hypothetical protein
MLEFQVASDCVAVICQKSGTDNRRIYIFVPIIIEKQLNYILSFGGG